MKIIRDTAHRGGEGRSQLERNGEDEVRMRESDADLVMLAVTHLLVLLISLHFVVAMNLLLHTQTETVRINNNVVMIDTTDYTLINS